MRPARHDLDCPPALALLRALVVADEPDAQQMLRFLPH
jgi:hypothetical protein